MSYPGGVLTLNYDYDPAGEVTKIRENGATSGVGVLASYAYDDLGRRTSVTYGNGSVQSFAYDAASRLATLTNNLGGAATTHDLTQTFTYNPADQIASVARSNDAYAWQAHYNVDRSYTINGLNRIMNIGSTAFTYDGRGNLTSDGTNAFTYTSENLLKTGPSTTLAYDPLGRLYETVKSPTTTRFLYDGADLIGEYNGSNAVQRRYVHGPGVDEPIVWYEGGTVSNTTRRFLMADERGSVVSVTDSAGATIHINAYDEYGIPAPGNIGRFGYTGQTWLPELGMWYYKARLYSPTLGRFMQTDPIGYNDGMNWYNYVGSDPVNGIDPTGLQDSDDGREIIINGKLIKLINIYDRGDVNIWTGGFSIADLGTDPNEIVVTAKPKQGPDICSIGNGIVDVADKAGNFSLKLGGLGGSLFVYGTVTGNKLAVDGGAAVMTLAGFVGEGAGVLQIAGGAVQWAGGGDGVRSNVVPGVFSMGSGVVFSKIFAQVPKGAWGNAKDRFQTNNIIIGGTFSTLQQLPEWLSAKQVNCP